MKYRQLGNAGVRVSVIGLGTNTFGSAKVSEAEVKNILDAAQDLGINLIDTADQYTDGQSETAIGKALKGRWDRFVVATKFFFPMGEGPNDRGTSRYHMMNTLEGSLRRLQTDHVDIYYIHRWDDSTPIEETLRALDDVVRQGKVRYVGASMFASWQLAHANLLAEVRGWMPLVVLQSRYNMLERDVEQEVLPYCRAHKVGFIPYFPLAGGFLTGKYRRGQPAPAGSRGENNPYVRGFMNDATFDKIEKVEAWARERGRGLNDLAQAWLLAQSPVCSVISGATRVDHIRANAAAAEWELTPAEAQEVTALLG